MRGESAAETLELLLCRYLFRAVCANDSARFIAELRSQAHGWQWDQAREGIPAGCISIVDGVAAKAAFGKAVCRGLEGDVREPGKTPDGAMALVISLCL